MELYQRQQFDFFLMTATERYVERLQQRFRGAEQALIQLREAPESEGVWLQGFVDAVFEDFLLNETSGACFVLQGLAKRPIAMSQLVSALPTDSVAIERVLGTLAKATFRDLLRQKSLEMLEQQSGYQPVAMGETP